MGRSAVRGTGFLTIWSDIEPADLTDYRHWLTLVPTFSLAALTVLERAPSEAVEVAARCAMVR
jgi:hypothetical protein